MNPVTVRLYNAFDVEIVWSRATEYEGTRPSVSEEDGVSTFTLQKRDLRVGTKDFLAIGFFNSSARSHGIGARL